MNFAVVMAPEALADLGRLPQQIAARVRKEIDGLAGSPSRARTRPAPALYPPGQMFETQFDYDDMTCIVAVIFHYMADETTLSISRVLVEFD